MNRDSIETLIHRRLSRRSALKGVATAAVLTQRSTPVTSGSSINLEFDSIRHVYPRLPNHAAIATRAEVASGHKMQVLLRWGDGILKGAPALDPANQTAAAQATQFGYNNDFIAFMPLPKGSNSSDHGLLCVNHEYTNSELMFDGLSRETMLQSMSPEQLRIEMAAHGHSVVEIHRTNENGQLVWKPTRRRSFNRRITASGTNITISGPAAGHSRLRTRNDPTGTQVVGTVNNCAGGVTPWNTVLFAEENFHYYFSGGLSKPREATNYHRYRIGKELNYAWSRIDPRFNTQLEPHEPNRFGWVVEFDPYQPNSTPVKRTALGRFCHEGASVVLNWDDRVVVYMGDDTRFEFLYKFVTAGRFDPDRPESNKNLLDQGTLFVARFRDDGVVQWLPLIYGQGPLRESNGFRSQADVLIEARVAASLLGATPMDRPEGIETSPSTGHVFVVLTNNALRSEGETNRANPRPRNLHGHILELMIPSRGGGRDHGASEHRWDLFLKAGGLADGGSYQGHDPSDWLSCPDNCALDNKARLWIATDGAAAAAGFTDGLYVCDTEGPRKALTQQFFRVPVGAEVCGPCFTPDCSTLFVAVQHPAEGSTKTSPSTRWPNPAGSALPPQPAVVAIYRDDLAAVAS